MAMRPTNGPPTKLSLVEGIDLIYKLLAVVATGVFAALTYPFCGNRRAKTYRSHVTHAVLRKLSSSLTVRQLQLQTTAASYNTYAKSRGLIPQTVSWGEGGHGHWVGRSDASKVLVWFHGGGFYAPACPAYFEFLEDLVETVCQSGRDFAVFVPSYTLAPHSQYPAQLREGVDALRYLVEEQGKLLGNIVIGGDSAGGNLVLGILSHASHPHPELPAGPITAEPLSGALMLSPWVSCDTKWPSIERNRYKDCVTLAATDISAKYFLGDKHWDNYNEPLQAPWEWWTGVKAHNLLLVSGEDEIMVDAHKAFATNLSTANPGKTKLIIAAGEGHVAPVLDLMLGDHSVFESTKAIKEWLLSSL